MENLPHGGCTVPVLSRDGVFNLNDPSCFVFARENA
jgi:hypothetical protein